MHAGGMMAYALARCGAILTMRKAERRGLLGASESPLCVGSWIQPKKGTASSEPPREAVTQRIGATKGEREQCLRKSVVRIAMPHCWRTDSLAYFYVQRMPFPSPPRSHQTPNYNHPSVVFCANTVPFGDGTGDAFCAWQHNL